MCCGIKLLQTDHQTVGADWHLFQWQAGRGLLPTPVVRGRGKAPESGIIADLLLGACAHSCWLHSSLAGPAGPPPGRLGPVATEPNGWSYS